MAQPAEGARTISGKAPPWPKKGACVGFDFRGVSGLPHRDIPRLCRDTGPPSLAGFVFLDLVAPYISTGRITPGSTRVPLLPIRVQRAIVSASGPRGEGASQVNAKMPPKIASHLLFFAPECWGELKRFSELCLGTYAFSGREQRALAGVGQHFEKADTFRRIAEVVLIALMYGIGRRFLPPLPS